MIKHGEERAEQASELQNQKDAALVRKTQVETQVLEQQLGPWYRQLSITAIIAVLAGLGSVWSWVYQQSKDRQIRSEERLDRALALLADNQPNKRVAAVTSLESFLEERDDAKNTQVLQAIAGALALEDSAPVRNAIISAIEDVDPSVLSRTALDRGLRSLVEANRGLVKEGDVWLRRPENINGVEQGVKVGARLLASANAIVLMLKKGARTAGMSGVYLAKADLKGLDLSNTSFDQAILVWTDFTNASLRGSSFDGADLEDTKFISADLRDSKFVLTNKDNFAIYLEDYVARDMAWPHEYMHIEQPDFSCSDLRNADFSGHSVFGVAADDFPIQFMSTGPQFSRANLKNADFTNAQIFGVNLNSDSRFPFTRTPGLTTQGFISSGAHPVTHWTAKLTSDSLLSNDYKAFTARLNNFTLGFVGSNWRQAKLPTAIKQWLEQEPPEKLYPNYSGSKCEPRATED